MLLRQPRVSRSWLTTKLSLAQQEEFSRDWVNLEQFPTLEALLEKYKEAGSVNKLRFAAYRICKPRLPNRVKLQRARAAQESEHIVGKNQKSTSHELNVETILQNLPLEDRQWDDPEVFEVNADAWGKPGQRVGRMSRIDYFGEGFRRGGVREECRIFAHTEGVHFIVINAGLVDKEGLKIEFKNRFEKTKDHVKDLRKTARERKEQVAAVSIKALRNQTLNSLLDEAAKALAAILPRLKKPSLSHQKDGSNEYIRYYITTSPRYDGPHGEEIARRLQQLRIDDIRCYKPGSARTRVKGINKFIWSINPMRNRIPGKYYSQAAEKEIEEKEAQTSQEYPDIWCVGGLGSAIYKGEGKRDVAYMTDPASSRLETAPLGENQIGVAIVEYPVSDGMLVPGMTERLVRYWSLRDLIAREREFITGIKEGSQKIHRLIVDLIKREGALSVGLIHDELPMYSRENIESALKFLEEPKASSRKTWPGICYYPEAQLYDFHMDWIREKLRYSMPRLSECKEDSFLFTGCNHIGYRTTDYDFIVKYIPLIMQRRNTQVLVSLGDEIAGLRHDFLCTGEVFSGLNNTGQEIFAAELRAEIIFRVFKPRFDEMIKGKNIKELTLAELRSIVEHCVVLFLIIPGNHDLWQERDGITPLAQFMEKLRILLTLYITRYLAVEKGIPLCINVSDIVHAKIKLFYDVDALYELQPSKIRLSMAHPHMGDTATSSLRAQHAIATHDAQVSAIANFHTAIVIHNWKQKFGECVSVQVGTQAIYTRFEKRKMKRGVDFGPVALRVLSHNGRILMTETSYYNKPILKEAISKSTDIAVFRRKLDLEAVKLGISW